MWPYRHERFGYHILPTRALIFFRCFTISPKSLSLKYCRLNIVASSSLLDCILHPILLQLYSICTTYTLQTCQNQFSLTLVSHFNKVRFNNFYWSFLCICKYKICDSSAMQYASNKVYQQLKKTRWCIELIYIYSYM